MSYFRLHSFLLSSILIFSLPSWASALTNPSLEPSETLAVQEQPSGFLLRQQTRLVAADLGFDSTIETVIFRDGVVLMTVAQGEFLTVSRRQATPQAVQTLHETFSRFHIGQQAGNCRQTAGQFDLYRVTTSWFTHGPRGHTFRVGNEFDQPCESGVSRLLDEISQFVFEASPEPGVQDIKVPK